MLAIVSNTMYKFFSDCINTETRAKPADPQTVRFSIEQDDINNKMLEIYGKEGANISFNSWF